MKNITKATIMTGLTVTLLGATVPEEVTAENIDQVELTEVYYQDGNVQEYAEFHLEDGDTLVMLSDESYAIANLKNNTFVFQPTDLVDYRVEVNNADQFKDIINTYLNSKNN